MSGIFSTNGGQLLSYPIKIFSAGRTAFTPPEEDILYREDSFYPT
jgi:hypothetical protein